MSVQIELNRNHPKESELAWMAEDPQQVSFFELYRANRPDALLAGYTKLATIPNVPGNGRYSWSNMVAGSTFRPQKTYYSASKSSDLTYYYKIVRLGLDRLPISEDATFDDIVARTILSYEETQYYGSSACAPRPMQSGQIEITVSNGATFDKIHDFKQLLGRPASRLRILTDEDITVRLNNINNCDQKISATTDPAVPFQFGDEGSDGSLLHVFRMYFANSSGSDATVTIQYSFLVQ